MKGLLERLNEQRKSNSLGSNCDISFIFEGDKEGKSVRAHKFVLSTYSAVFKQNFDRINKKSRHRLADSPPTDVDPHLPTISVSNTSYRSFKYFIDVLYAREEISKCHKTNRLVDCIQLASEYKIKDLFEDAKTQLVSLLDERVDLATMLGMWSTLDKVAHCEDLCIELGRQSANALKNHLKTANDVCKLWRELKSKPKAFDYLFNQSDFRIQCANLLQTEINTVEDVFKLWADNQDIPDLVNLLMSSRTTQSKLPESEESYKSQSISKLSCNGNVSSTTTQVLQQKVENGGASSDTTEHSTNKDDLLKDATRNDGPSSSSSSKRPRKRKRKNKNKNKLPLSEVVSFEDMDIDVSNYKEKTVNNKRKVFDNESTKSSDTDSEAAAATSANNHTHNQSEEYSLEDIQALYKMSTPARCTPVEVSSQRQLKDVSVVQSTPDRKTEEDYSSSTECEKAIMGQTEISRVAKKQKLSPSIVFRPRVLNIQELRREKPVSITTDETSTVQLRPSPQDTTIVDSTSKVEVDAVSDQLQNKANAINDVYQNASTVIQNPKDYNDYHAVSEGGPRLNDIIAFKMIEISENYTPELSEFKEGRVVNIDDKGVVTFEILNETKLKRNGKFELNPEDEGVAQDLIVQLNWRDVMDPRLVFP